LRVTWKTSPWRGTPLSCISKPSTSRETPFCVTVVSGMTMGCPGTRLRRPGR
jgi:hypothetical protein